MASVERVLAARKEAYGDIGCPAAMVTDNVWRDHSAVAALVRRVFPTVWADATKRPVICQDIIHRFWAFSRVLLPKQHPDCATATREVKDIFSRFL